MGVSGLSAGPVYFPSTAKKTPPFYAPVPADIPSSFQLHVHWFTFYGEPDLKFTVDTNLLLSEGVNMLHFTYDPVTKHWESIEVKDR
jgi:hypothetical protein